MNASISRTLLVFCFVGVALQPTTTQAQNTDPSEELLGTWSAEEDYFRPVFRFKRDNDGTVTAFLTNDRSQKGNPFSSTTVRGDSIFLELAPANARFQGALSEDGSRIEGKWMQRGRTASLTLTPVSETAATEPNRPQRPEPPYPYVSEEVTFRHEAGGITIAGTMTRPEGEGPFPGVVLLHGSGANERDYEINGHKPFLVLADHLTRQGIAVLRYDMRGAGASEGSFRSAHLEDLARDAASALRFLKERPEVKASEAGLVAHSMGTLLAPWAAEQFQEASFLVLLMPPSQPGHEMLVAQNARLAEAAGASDAEVDSIRQEMHRLFDVIRSDLDSVAVAAQVRSILKQQGVANGALEARVEANTTPWWRDFARHDPRPRLEKIGVPTLALFGSKDLFVPPEQNAKAMRAALAASPSDDAAVQVLDGLNHWLQPAETGLPREIAQIEMTIAPALLSDLADWIQGQTSADE
jgi:pimeloyl-ACP methyl ester carboxylesterase